MLASGKNWVRVALAVLLALGLCPSTALAGAGGNASLTPASLTVHEYDNANTAKMVPVNETQRGSLVNGSDSDWYRFATPSDGYVSLTFGHDYSTEGRGWTVRLYGTDASTEFRSWSFEASTLASETTCNIGFQAGTYYAKVEPRDSWSPTTAIYNVTVNFTASGVWEHEPDDDALRGAHQISPGITYYGTTHDGDDSDWYRFTTASDGYVSLTFGHDYSTEGRGWTVRLYGTDASTQIATWSFSPDANAAESHDVTMAGGDCYMIVEPRDAWSRTTADYNVRVNYQSAVKDISVAAVTLSPSSYVYDGGYKQPSVTVRYGGATLSQGTDYTVSYANNRDVGTATATVTGRGDYTGSKTATFVITPATSPGRPMHRLYNPNSGEHFYTASDAERGDLVWVGWRYEGVAWSAPETSSTPVYRLYNPNSGDHHYTVDSGERDFLVAVGWHDEGVGWYSDDSRRVPLLRAYNPNAATGSHNYTASQSEQRMLISAGWHDEGIGWYGI